MEIIGIVTQIIIIAALVYYYIVRKANHIINQQSLTVKNLEQQLRHSEMKNKIYRSVRGVK